MWWVRLRVDGIRDYVRMGCCIACCNWLVVCKWGDSCCVVSDLWSKMDGWMLSLGLLRNGFFLRNVWGIIYFGGFKSSPCLETSIGVINPSIKNSLVIDRLQLWKSSIGQMFYLYFFFPKFNLLGKISVQYVLSLKFRIQK